MSDKQPPLRLVSANGENVPARWKAQMCGIPRRWKDDALMARNARIYEQLVALGPSPDIADVDRIIGNQSWTHLTCSGCNEYIAKGVEFGDSWSAPVVLCPTCVQAAAKFLNGTGGDSAEAGA